MDALVDQARLMKARIPGAKRDAVLAYYWACARVVDDERARGDRHGAQARAAKRLGISAQYLGRMLTMLAEQD